MRYLQNPKMTRQLLYFRLEMFLPLEVFIMKTLKAQRADLEDEGRDDG